MFRALLAVAVGALVAALLFPAFPRPPRRNVLLLSIETFRADRLGAVRNGESLTPNLDALARRGTRFTNAYAAASFTIPSLHSIATGEPPRVHRVQFWTNFGNPYTGTTLQQEFHADGRATGFVYSTQGLLDAWPILRRGWTGAPAGFDRADDGPVEAASQWLDAHGTESFYLWVHLFHPHTPYAPPEEFVDAADLAAYRAAGPATHTGKDETGKDHTVEDWAATVPGGRGPELADALYEADIRAADAAAGRLLADLERRGLLDTTVICVVSDHGENLSGDKSPRWEHGFSTDEQLIRVPLIFAGPGVPMGVVDPAIARHVDLAPTLVRLAGASSGHAWHGRSLFGGSPPPFAIAECTVHDAVGHPMYSVTDGSRSLRIYTLPAPWLYLYHPDERNRAAPPLSVGLTTPALSEFAAAWDEETSYCNERASELNDPAMDDGARDDAQRGVLDKVPYIGERKR